MLVRHGPATAMSASLILLPVCALAGAFFAAALASVAVAIGAVALVMNRTAHRIDTVTLAIQRNLASRGENKADELTAATLDRSVFPRLLATMDDEREPVPGTDGRTETRQTPQADYPEQLVSCAALQMRNLVNEWNVALRSEDLATCRRIHATLIDTAPTQTLAPMKTLLEKLADHVEHKLRRSFAHHVGEREFSEAIAVGEEIRRLFPHGAIAEEFERIKPYLLRRVV